MSKEVVSGSSKHDGEDACLDIVKGQGQAILALARPLPCDRRPNYDSGKLKFCCLEPGTLFQI